MEEVHFFFLIHRNLRACHCRYSPVDFSRVYLFLKRTRWLDVSRETKNARWQRRRRPSLNGRRMAIRNFRNDSEPRGASSLSRGRAKDAAGLLFSFLRPFVFSGKRAARIDYVPDWRLAAR